LGAKGWKTLLETITHDSVDQTGQVERKGQIDRTPSPERKRSALCTTPSKDGERQALQSEAGDGGRQAADDVGWRTSGLDSYARDEAVSENDRAFMV